MPKQPHQLVEKYKEFRAGIEEGTFDKNKRVTVKEALSTPDASIIMPKVIADVMRDAAEPMYIGSRLLQIVRLTEGRSIEFPAISAMRAFDVAEGQELMVSSPIQ